MKKNISLYFFLAIFIIIANIYIPVLAQSNTESSIKILINGNELQTDISPMTINGRVFVPFRTIFEALGAKVEWDEESKLVKGIRDDVQITLQVNSTKANINNEEIIIDSAPFVHNDRIMVPIRFVAESLGEEVEWNSKNKTVIVGAKDNENNIADFSIEQIIKLIKEENEIIKNDCDNLLLVNRYNPLSADFKAKNLVELSSSKIKLSANKAVLNKVVADSLYKMLDAAKKDNVTGFIANSTVRDIEEQKKLYEYRLSINKKNKVKDPEYETLKRVAKPGTSEHHTGLSIDILSINSNSSATFGKTKQSEWLNENCHQYGFIIRYPEDKQKITETTYEPWHIRYVGFPHSMIMKKENMCFEEYIEYLKENKNINYKLNDEEYSMTYVNLDGDLSELYEIYHDLSQIEISKVVENEYVLIKF